MFVVIRGMTHFGVEGNLYPTAETELLFEEKHYGSLLNVLKWNESSQLHFSHHCLTGNMANTHLAANLTICLLAWSPTAIRACTVNCW